MIKDLFKLFGSFVRRMQEDHMGAYAATCAYFLMISFVPLYMIVMAIAQRTNADISVLSNGLLSVVPAGLKEYISTIIREVQAKSYAFVPLSLIILIWSAAKVLHAISSGLNVISKVPENRGWFFLRFRSMLYVVLFISIVAAALAASIFQHSIGQWARSALPSLTGMFMFFYSFRSLFGYFALIAVFLFIYKFLPNCHYSVRSQLPGALLISTVWMFFSYLMAVYYRHNQNFNNIYGSVTGMVLAMIWLYFCFYFLFFGAELNRVFYEDPENNFVVSAISILRDASARRQQEIEDELDQNSVWKPIRGDRDVPSRQPADIHIRWQDEEVRSDREKSSEADDFYRGAVILNTDEQSS